MRGGRETNLSIFFLFSFNIEKVLEMCSIFRLILAFSILNLSVNVYANQPIARFKNRTIGILSESDAGVFISTEKVTILGDLEVKATNQTTNITQQVDSLIRLQSNMELRVNTFAQHANMGVVCDPEGTEYRARNFENDEFGACICKEGYAGDICLPTRFSLYSVNLITADACFTACGNSGVVVAYSDADVALISTLIPTQNRVWVGLKKESEVWMHGNEVYDGTTRWHNSNEGNTGEIRAGMVFNNGGVWAGDWYDMNNDGRKHYCVCNTA